MAFSHAPVVKLAALLRRPSRFIRSDGSDLAVRIALASYSPPAYARSYRASLAKRRVGKIDPWRELADALAEHRLAFDGEPAKLVAWLRGALKMRGLQPKPLLAWYDPKRSYPEVGRKLLVVLPQKDAKNALLLAGKRLQRLV
jgi:hypothetical protein